MDKLKYWFNSILNYLLFYYYRRKARKHAVRSKYGTGVIAVNGKLRVVDVTGLRSLNKHRLKNKQSKISIKQFMNDCYVYFHADGSTA